MCRWQSVWRLVRKALQPRVYRKWDHPRTLVNPFLIETIPRAKHGLSLVETEVEGDAKILGNIWKRRTGHTYTYQ